jgi:TonB family protein
MNHFKISTLLQNIFNKRSFAVFLTISTFIHLALLISIPTKKISRDFIHPDIFDVDIISLPDTRQNNLYKKFIKEPTTPIQSEKNGYIKNINKGLKADNSNIAREKEATVSLYSDNKNNSIYTSYLASLRDKIDSTWQYPSFEKEHGIEGIVTLRFSIGEHGELIDINLTEPSNHLQLNQEAIRAILDASPFNQFPESFSISRLNVLATFTYNFYSTYPAND